MNLLAELASLASLASSRPDLTLQVGKPDCNWSFNWATSTITVNPTDLALRPPDYCRGLILHESAHAALTRVADIIPRDLYQADIHILLNAIEDCRIENWLQLRFPGSRPWIRLYNNRILGRPADSINAHLAGDPAGGFLAGLLDHWWNETSVLTLHPETKSALEEVLPYFDEAVAAFPDPQAPNAVTTRRLYASHPVSLCFRSQDYDVDPSPEECIIRMLQHRMWAITWAHIVPVFRRLLDHPDSEPTRRHIARLAEELREVDASITSSGKPIKVIVSQSARHTGIRPAPGTGKGSFQNGDLQTYAKAVATHAALIESCADTLLRVLTADSRPKRTRFHRSGHALDLRVAMQFEADPRLHEKLWQRTSLPKHPDPAFVVLVDASGSMRGERAEATFAGLVVLREVCLRLGIPLSIIAFNNRPKLLQSWDHPQAAGVQSRLTGLLQPRSGTWLSPALDMASALFEQSSNLHRHLWILSDGNTAGPDEARQKIRSIRRGGAMIHGLGLGPDSHQIAELIPKAAVGIQPEGLANVFAEMLQTQVKP